MSSDFSAYIKFLPIIKKAIVSSGGKATGRQIADYVNRHNDFMLQHSDIMKCLSILKNLGYLEVETTVSQGQTKLHFVCPKTNPQQLKSMISGSWWGWLSGSSVKAR
jgi:hypothetical protein